MTTREVSFSGSSKIATKVKVKKVLIVEKIYYDETPEIMIEPEEKIHECMGSSIYTRPPPTSACNPLTHPFLFLIRTMGGS
jgi:hypothetical protein